MAAASAASAVPSRTRALVSSSLAVEIGDGGRQRACACLQRRGGKKRIVHLLPQREQRGADARLVLGELRALERPLRAHRRVEQPLIEANAAVIRVLRRLEESADERRRRREVRDVGLVLRLAVDRDRRQTLRADVAQAEVRLLHEQLQLVRSRIRIDRGLLQHSKIK